MTVLIIRTDKPEAEVGLYQDTKQLSYITWLAHRELSNTIHITLKKLLEENNCDWHEIEGLVFYEGPGSFTGLRIGASVANALSLSLKVPIVSTGGDTAPTGPPAPFRAVSPAVVTTKRPTTPILPIA